MYWLHFLLAVVLGLVGNAAYAACSAPEGTAGQVIFSETAKAMQYCNGTNWINTGAVIANAPNTGCSNPTGRRGSVIFNASQGVVQFCNGSNWVDTACARDRKKNGSGCTGGGKAGTIRYVGGSVNELQFCDSTDWVAMGWPCGPVVPLNVADVFSTDLYTGNGSTQTITNGIDLAGQGGMVWGKPRSTSGQHMLQDTVRGIQNYLQSNATTQSQNGGTDHVSSVSVSGFDLGNGGLLNTNGTTYAAWTFRKAPKFFDVVTYTGDGVNGRVFSHNFGSPVGMVIIKNLSSSANWNVWHRNATSNLSLNSTGAEASTDATWTGTVRSVTDSTFTLYSGGGGISSVNTSGHNYVAYLFAHDPSPEGVIQCGSYIGGSTVTLGWRPQFIISKKTDTTDNWRIQDAVRGLSGAANSTLNPNTADAQSNQTGQTANTTGFQDNNGSSGTYIYCAIRAKGS